MELNYDVWKVMPTAKLRETRRDVAAGHDALMFASWLALADERDYDAFRMRRMTDATTPDGMSGTFASLAASATFALDRVRAAYRRLDWKTTELEPVSGIWSTCVHGTRKVDEARVLSQLCKKHYDALTKALVVIDRALDCGEYSDYSAYSSETDSRTSSGGSDDDDDDDDEESNE